MIGHFEDHCRLLQTDGQMKKRGVKRVNSGRRISRTIRGELKVSQLNDSAIDIWNTTANTCGVSSDDDR